MRKQPCRKHPVQGDEFYKEFWIKKWISELVVDSSGVGQTIFINHGGPPVFKLHFLGGAVAVD